MRMLIPFVLLAIAACDTRLPSPKGRRLTREEVQAMYDRLGEQVVYFRDKRTGACFAILDLGNGPEFTSVDCTDKIEALTLNAPPEAGSGGHP